MAAADRRMGLSTKLLALAFGLLLQLDYIFPFNMDLKGPLIFRSADPNSYFGYSLSFHDRGVFVGAPKATQNGKTTGAIYKCPIKRLHEEECKLYLKKDQVAPSSNYIEEGQMLGATVYSDQERLLTCAPRFAKVEDGEELMIGKCNYINSQIDVSTGDTVFNPCDSDNSLVKGKSEIFGACEIGFSAKTTVDKIYSGAFTNKQNNTEYGNIAVRVNAVSKFSPTTGLNISDYMGYAVTSGKFKKNKGILIVGGAPRGNDLGGKVMLYDSEDPNYKVFSSIPDPSSPQQTGSYFGSAVASADINGDGFADLVVGAPQYDNDKPNQGAVYVYMNDKNDGLVLSKQVLYGVDEDGFFGYAIGSVGDLNDDQMQEIAVGAPWGGENKDGYVNIYYGSTNKEAPLVLKQVVKPSNLKTIIKLEGLGFAFADFYPYAKDSMSNNFDNAGYNELAIGAYKSGHVVVLKSRPVVTFTGKLQLGGITKIDLYNADPNTLCDYQGKKLKCIKDVKACFQSISTKNQESTTLYPLRFTINLDAERSAAKRGFFDVNGNEETEFKSTLSDVTSTLKCAAPLTIYLKNNTKDILRAFTISMESVYDEQTCADGTICPIANELITPTQTTTIPYVKGCSDDGNDECNSDLVVSIAASIPGGGKSIAIGVTQTVTISVDVRNTGENAFINSLELIYPPVVSPNKVTIANFPGTVEWDPNSSLDSNVLTLKVKLSSPIKRNSVEKINVVFSVLNVGKGDKVVFKALALTGSKEMNPPDNTAEVSLSVSVSADLTVSGRVLPEQLKWNKNPEKTGPQIIHTFFFQNMGPSSAEESDVLVKIPEKIDQDYVLNIYDISLKPGAGVFGTIGKCDVEKDSLNPLKLDLSNRTFASLTEKRRKRREAEQATTARHDCTNDGSCRVIKCKLSRLGKSQSATLTIYSTLVETTFAKLKESRQLVASAKFSSTKVERPNGAAPDEIEVVLSVNSPYFTIEKEGGGIAWWIILLCILGAIIIIVIIVFILYKKGFFKRKKHGEEDEEEEGLRKGDPDDEY